MLTDQQHYALQQWMRGSLGPVEDSTRYAEDAVNALVAMAKTMYVVSEVGASPTASAAYNTAAINALIDAASAAGGGTVFFPPGIYLTSGLTLKANVVLRGISERLSLIKLADNSNVPVISASSINTVGLRDLGIDANERNQSSGNYQDVYFSSCNFVIIKNLRIDRNGDGTKGAVGTAAALHLAGGSEHVLHDIEVFGNDIGTGVRIQGADRFEVVNVHVRDMLYILGADPGDDRIEGVVFNNCNNFSAINVRVRNMTGNFPPLGAQTKYTRGITFAACSDWLLESPYVDNADQAIDVTGSDGNVRFNINNGLVADCGAYGFKFANSARDGVITNCTANRCGFVAFIVSGPSESGLAIKSGDLTFVNCAAYDTGSNGVWAGANISGFGVFTSAFDTDTPRGVRFIDCRAHDRQGTATMKYGFFNQVAAHTDGRYNEAVDCISIGHTTSAFEAMNQGRVVVGLSAAQLIPDNTWTLVTWSTETDSGAMYSPSDGQIFARRAGDYQIAAGVDWEANATGQRGLRLIGNGGVTIQGSTVLVNASGAGKTNLNVSWIHEMVAGDEVRVEVFQNSGVSLNISDVFSRAVVEQVS
jgi:hypothetical protein